MSRDQFARLEKLILGPPRLAPAEIIIHPDGEPQAIRPSDPPFFVKVMADAPTFIREPNGGEWYRRHNIPESTKREVLHRDGCECYLCGRTMLDGGLHFDHIIPVSRGGGNSADNIGVACAACNLRKGDRLTDKRPRALR